MSTGKAKQRVGQISTTYWYVVGPPHSSYAREVEFSTEILVRVYGMYGLITRSAKTSDCEIYLRIIVFLHRFQ